MTIFLKHKDFVFNYIKTTPNILYIYNLASCSMSHKTPYTFQMAYATVEIEEAVLSRIEEDLLISK